METINRLKTPAGLIDNSIEFFEDGNQLKCIYNRQIHAFADFPEYVVQKIKEGMAAEGCEDYKRLAEWTLKRYGHFDMEPDIDSNGNFMPVEYGEECRNLPVSNGSLTRKEIEVLKRVELPDKLIADQLNISIETVSSHWQSIRTKTEKRNKIELAVFAVLKGLI